MSEPGSSEADLRLLDAIGVAVVVVDLDGTIVRWNKGATALYGWAARDALARPVQSLLSPSASDAVAADIIASIAADGPWTGEWPLLHQSGATFMGRVTTSALRDESGYVIGYVGVAMSIENEVTARRAVEASERKFRALVARSSDGVVVIDAKGSVVYMSKALCDLLGVAEEGVIGRYGAEFVAAADIAKVREAATAHGRQRVIGPIDVRLRCADGTWVDVEGFRTDLLDDPDVAGLVWNLRDVSSTRQTQLVRDRTEERLRALDAGSSDVTFVMDLEGMIMYAGPAAQSVLGYSPDHLLSTLAQDLVHEDDIALVDATFDEILAGDDRARRMRFRIKHGDGSWRWVEALFTNLLENPAVGGLVSNIRDITDEHLADAALRDSESRYRSIVETAEEGIWIHDLHGRTTFANPKLASMLGTTVDAMDERSFFDFIEPAERSLAIARLARRRRGTGEQYEFALRAGGGARVDVLISASPLLDADGIVTGVLKMVTDIRDRKQAEAETVRLGLEDSLTGLASRALVEDRVTQILVRQRREPGLAAVLFLDLDNFKQVNDSLGHVVGDQFLCESARRITEAVRPQDTVARFGGDEFVVVLDLLETVSDAIVVAERISDALREPVSLGGLEVSTVASIGIALTPAVDTTSLMRDADTAMYRAKERGGGRHELFDSSLRDRAVARLELERDLRRAIDLHQFAVHYQPVVALDGTIVGFEALARWDHPTRGPVGPGEFIPLAESTGLIVELGAWILEQACRELAQWRSQPGRQDLTMAVNLSSRQLAEPDLPGAVAATLAAHGLNPAALWLEITESVLMDDTIAASAALSAIHDLGVRLSVDDFGTGYSSLLYLRRFPVDALKLDRFFIAGIDRNSQDPAIVRAVIDLAHSLGLVAIAEGVETSSQLETLRAMACDQAQGFHWSAAVPAEAVAALLATETLLPKPSNGRGFALPAPPVKAVPVPAGKPASRATVVVVDDSDGDRSLLYSHLEASGRYRVVGEAADGRTAVILAGRTKPDLVLLDMAMPGMDGLDTLPRLLEVSPTTRVVILSGYVSNGLRMHAVAAGATAVLEKGGAFESIVGQLSQLAEAAGPMAGDEAMEAEQHLSSHPIAAG